LRVSAGKRSPDWKELKDQTRGAEAAGLSLQEEADREEQALVGEPGGGDAAHDLEGDGPTWASREAGNSIAQVGGAAGSGPRRANSHPCPSVAPSARAVARVLERTVLGPAGERLVAHGPAVVEVDDRLVDRPHAAPIEHARQSVRALVERTDPHHGLTVSLECRRRRHTGYIGGLPARSSAARRAYSDGGARWVLPG